MNVGPYVKNKQPLVYRTFSNALASSRLAHAYLLLGEAGTPLKEVAVYLAKSLLCDHPDPLADEECLICQRIERADYPDFVLFDGSEDSVKKGDVSSLTSLFSQTALEEKGLMVYVIHLVENMTPEAANSLLKFLEEPPANTYAFLTSQNEAKILPTILSRCESMRLLLAPREEVIAEAVALGVAKEDAEVLSYFYNDASLVKAKAESEDYLCAKSCLDAFAHALPEGRGHARFIMEKEVIPQLKGKPALRFYFDMVALLFQDVAASKTRAAIALSSYATISKELAASLPHVEATLLAIMTMRGEIELNINPGLLLTHLADVITREQNP